MDSDMSEARRHKRREKTRFQSLLSMVDGEIQAEKEMEADSDGEEWEWEEGRRKSLFDPRR